MKYPSAVLLVSVCLWISFNILFVSLSSAEEVYSDAIHINEFIPNPEGNDSELEFIELYNSSSHDVDLGGWVVDTGGSAVFTIDNGTILAAQTFLTFYSADKNISLTNTSDHIQFIRPDAVVQDDITYTSSIEGYSYIRKDDGTYEGSSTPTPNVANVPATPMPTPTFEVTPMPMVDVHISEFLPNPDGDDGELEFIELMNGSAAPVDLSGWGIDTGPTSRFQIGPDISIPADGFLVFFSLSHDISLSNSGDHIQLIRPDNIVQDDISYSSSKEGYSYNRSDSGTYPESFTPTPNAANVITVSPTPTLQPSPSPIPQAEQKDVSYDFSSHVVINELLPNPKGSDEENEYIEIKNLDKKSIHLEGWILDDSAKGSGFHFSTSTIIGPGKILVFYRNVTKIALNNDTDMIKLLDPKGKVISTTTYEKPVVEGESWNRIEDGSFRWSAALTAGHENTIIVHEKPTPKPRSTSPAYRQVGSGQVRATKKPSALPTKSSVPSIVNTPSVLGARSQTLPWPEIVSSTHTVVDSTRPAFTGKQHLFLLVGGTVAFAQLIAGISRKEAIWRR